MAIQHWIRVQDRRWFLATACSIMSVAQLRAQAQAPLELHRLAGPVTIDGSIRGPPWASWPHRTMAAIIATARSAPTDCFTCTATTI